MKDSKLPLLASIVVRSYNRLDACYELLCKLLRQDYPNFEIVVIEQSTVSTPEQTGKLKELESQNSNLRILSYPPLGPPRARNEGWKNAFGEVVVFCDDDDIPISDTWLSSHMKNYGDADIIGVSGREVMTIGEQCGYSNRRRAERMCLSYGFLGYSYVYCRLDKRIDPVDWLHGGNASVRRSFIAAVDGWYENMSDHEEHSFAFRLQKILNANQRLVFDPDPVVLRRKNILGGLDRRTQTPKELYLRWFLYVHRILVRYRTLKVLGLYPIYVLWLLGLSYFNLWRSYTPGQGSIVRLSWTSLVILFASPIWYLQGWYSLIHDRKGRSL